ncbi:helix-turn-helix transcriptional regulator [Actinomyces sp. 186855]|nr:MULTISPECIES: helix-turn-helix transcriptional regulator [unclassified Actinomyces]MCL3777624.1 helix-turn-helix transcriptional regulator [Actinomyces sp. AC-20-1]MCL3789444.1 helix-turn-helix transcriptional regulator [Actinomyces sp. 187325]MCL3791176.1 helix-turn-helix transcriptional regulator [Actinomyces sp. 186855]MCL3794430.1 helix-turn-helix transcriptional regulator [Actinomyces sp. 217892]
METRRACWATGGSHDGSARQAAPTVCETNQTRGTHVKIEIAKRLYHYRTAAGLSQEQVAARVGVSRQAVSKWECAESSPDTDNLIALAVLYEVTVDELLFADPEQGPGARGAAGSGSHAQAPAESVTERVAESTREAVDEEVADVLAGAVPDAAASPGTDRFARWGGVDGDGAADDGRDYVNVSFENGIHVHDRRKGEEVHVDWDGVHVDTPTEHVRVDFAGLARAIREMRKRQR